MVRFANRGMRMHHCLCNKSCYCICSCKFDWNQRQCVFSISWNVLRVCVFRYANETGTKSVIHFLVLPLYNVLTAKSMSMILTRELWRKIICSPSLMNMSTLFPTICRNCGATIYGYKVLIKPYRRIILFSQHRRRKRVTWDFGV